MLVMHNVSYNMLEFVQHDLLYYLEKLSVSALIIEKCPENEKKLDKIKIKLCGLKLNPMDLKF